MAAYLNARGFCETPGTLEPDTGLVPNPDAPSESKSKPQSASSPEPQAAKETQQIDSQPAKDALQMDSQPAMPAAAPAPTDSPVIVQGQTVPADGHQITVNNQIVRISSGSIYVGSSAAPIPQVQAAQSHDQFLVAGTLTFHPALPSQSPQAAPVPAVVGGLTFSALQSEPSVEADTAKSQTQAQPVVIGGKTYAPVNPQAGVSQEQANTPKQGDSELSSSHEQSSNAIDDESAQTGSKPIVIGGLEYTLVTASPTSSPQSESIFYYDGVALTQGGKAVMVSSTLISLGPSGVVVGTSTLSLSTPTPAVSLLAIGSETSTPTPAVSLLAIGSETLTALGGSEGGFKIDDFTLLPGSSAAIINGTTLSINAADSLIVGTSTIPLATAGSGNKGNGVLTADGKTFTPLGSTAIVVDGTTISIGGSAITENGTRLSLASNGLLIGSSTFAYATPVANTATVSTASGTFRTSVLPSGGATPTAVPSATGSVGRSAASVKTITPGVIAIWFGISMALLMMIELS